MNSNTKKLIGLGLALALTFATGVAYTVSRVYGAKLDEAKQQVTEAVAGGRRMEAAATNALTFAAEQKRIADSLEAFAAKRVIKASVSKVTQEAPDTCAAVVDALIEVAQAYEEQKEAAGRLRSALDAVSDTLQATRDTLQNVNDKAEALVNIVKKPSVLDILLHPKLNITLGPQVGVNWKGKMYTGTGATAGLSWSIPL